MVVTITGARVVVGGLVVVSARVTIGAFVATGVVFSVVVEQAVKSKTELKSIEVVFIR